MFKQRLLTTLILIPLVLLLIYYANYWVIGSIVLLVTLGCLYEWLQLIPIQNNVIKLLFLAVFIAECYLIQFYFHYWLITGLTAWIFVLVFVQQFPKSQFIWGHALIVAFLCLLFLPLFAQSLMTIFMLEKGRGLIVYLLCLVWAADIGAYLGGKQWGNHKLIPRVSPGKTYEGALSGFLLSMVVAVVGAYCFQPQAPGHWFIIAVLVTLISLLGDLFISMLKRRTNIKDTGNLLPGHGGVLDRLDSLIAAAPLFSYGLYSLAPGL